MDLLLEAFDILYEYKEGFQNGDYVRLNTILKSMKPCTIDVDAVVFENNALKLINKKLAKDVKRYVVETHNLSNQLTKKKHKC